MNISSLAAIGGGYATKSLCPCGHNKRVGDVDYYYVSYVDESLS